MASILRSTFCGLVALALAAAPLAASAAKLSQVRVGTHEDHTRIVLELDAAASYRLSPPGEGGSQLQIQLDADSVARHVASKSPLVKSVRVEPSQRGSTISVDLSKSGIEVSEMVLADPPRIVLDLKPVGSTAAMAAIPAPKPAPAPAAKPEPTPEPAPAPKVAAVPAPAAAAPPAEGRLVADGRPVADATVKPVAPAGVAPSLADPVPNDIAKPAARFDAPVAKPEPTPPAAVPTAAPKPSAKADKPASANPEIVAKPATPETAAKATNPEIVAKAAETKPAVEPAPPTDAKPAADAARVEPSSPTPAPAAKPAEVVVRKATPVEAKKTAPAEAASWTDWLTSPTGYAAIGGVLLAGVVLAVRRRRRDEDDDPLYSVMSADDAGADDGDMRGQDHEDPIVEWGGNPDAAEQPTYAAVANFDADEPISRDGSQQLALGRLQMSEPEEPALPTVADADPDDSLFDGPGAPLVATAQPTSISVPSDSSYGGDASRIAGELESRVKDMERRIEQLAEARERLERQVAAQTEELRVQRAAIARTQRVVRTMTKGEDLATEPVPRAPQA